MPTIVDTLTVRLTADTSHLTKNLQIAGTAVQKSKVELVRQFKDVDQATKKTTLGFEGLAKSAVGFFAVLIGTRGVSEFISNMTRMNVALSNFSGLLDIQPQSVFAWGMAVAEVGGKASDAEASIARLRKTFAQWKVGQINPEMLRYGALGGVNFNPNDDYQTQLDKIGEMLQTIRNNPRYGADVAKNAADTFGVDPNLALFLEQHGNKSSQYVSSLNPYAPTDKQLANSKELYKNWVDLVASAQALGRVLLDDINPQLEKAVGFTKGMLDDFNKWLAGDKEWIAQQDKRAKETSGTFWNTDLGKAISEWWNGTGDDGNMKFHGSLTEDTPGAGGATVNGAPVSDANPLPVKPVVPPASQGSWGNFLNSLGNGLSGMASGVGSAVRSIFGAGSANASELPTGSATGAMGDRVGTAMAAAMDQLRKEGVPEEHLQAAASMLVGNAMAESSLNPRQSHDSGTGYGIYGARLGRRDKMLAWLKENGYSPDSLEGQSRYMAHEAMSSDYGPTRAALLSANEQSVGSGAVTVRENFESPSVHRDPARIAGAWQAYKTGPRRSSAGMSAADISRVHNYDLYMWYLRHQQQSSIDAGRMSREAMLASGSVSGSSTTNNRHLTTGPVTINTRATDADGIARDFYKRMAHTELAAFGNYGAA